MYSVPLANIFPVFAVLLKCTLAVVEMAQKYINKFTGHEPDKIKHFYSPLFQW